MKFERIAAWILVVSGGFEAFLLGWLLFRIRDFNGFLHYLLNFGFGWVVYVGWVLKGFGKRLILDPNGLWILSIIVHCYWVFSLFWSYDTVHGIFWDFDHTNHTFSYLQVRFHVVLAVVLSSIAMLMNIKSQKTSNHRLERTG